MNDDVKSTALAVPAEPGEAKLADLADQLVV